MGVWGVAHNLGQATGNMISGATVDLVQALQGDALTAYGLVFALEAALLLGALWLLKDIKITEARVFSKTDLGQPELL
jgi:BCD family chlorophyll transporter-like MFS transporter